MAPRCPGPIHAITASQGETVRTFSELTKDQLTESHDSANKLISEKYRSYLPGRLLPLLLRRYRDNRAEALGMPLPELPHRAGQVRAVALDDLTTAELDDVSGAVLVLVTRYADTMDDPALPELLRDFRDALVIEKAERAGVAAEMRARAW
jgi:hypothetical protein